MIGEYLKNDENIESIFISAYTDSYGGRWINMELSKKRAKAIKDYMASMGVPAEKIQTEGFGETRPAASNDTEEGRQRNRRVEFRVIR